MNDGYAVKSSRSQQRTFTGIVARTSEQSAGLVSSFKSHNKVSYRKQIARQHSCHKILARAGGRVDPVKFYSHPL